MLYTCKCKCKCEWEFIFESIIQAITWIGLSFGLFLHRILHFYSLMFLVDYFLSYLMFTLKRCDLKYVLSHIPAPDMFARKVNKKKFASNISTKNGVFMQLMLLNRKNHRSMDCGLSRHIRGVWMYSVPNYFHTHIL